MSVILAYILLKPEILKVVDLIQLFKHLLISLAWYLGRQKEAIVFLPLSNPSTLDKLKWELTYKFRVLGAHKGCIKTSEISPPSSKKKKKKKLAGMIQGNWLFIWPN